MGRKWNLARIGHIEGGGSDFICCAGSFGRAGLPTSARQVDLLFNRCYAECSYVSCQILRLIGSQGRAGLSWSKPHGRGGCTLLFVFHYRQYGLSVGRRCRWNKDRRFVGIVGAPRRTDDVRCLDRIEQKRLPQGPGRNYLGPRRRRCFCRAPRLPRNFDEPHRSCLSARSASLMIQLASPKSSPTFL